MSAGAIAANQVPAMIAAPAGCASQAAISYPGGSHPVSAGNPTISSLAHHAPNSAALASVGAASFAGGVR